MGGISSTFISAENIVCSTKNNTDSIFKGIALNGLERNPMITVTDGYETNTSQIKATSISSPKFFTTNGDDLLAISILYSKAPDSGAFFIWKILFVQMLVCFGGHKP